MAVLLDNISPKLDEILAPTYGQLIFQEQVTEIAMKLAGYSAGKADKIRKTIGRKIKEELDALIPDLLKAFQEYGGLSKENAQKLATSIQACSGYLFNKAHSAEYGLIAYQTAYLKANYPLEYMCSLLNGNIGDSDKVVEYIEECKKMGIKIIPPDVSFGNNEFELYDYESIIMGLTYIKGINNITIEYDPDDSLQEFFNRNGYNKRIKEALIKAGACDCFNMTRGEMLNIALDYHTELENAKTNLHKKEEYLYAKSAELENANRATKKYATLVKQVERAREAIESYEKSIDEIKTIISNSNNYDVVKGEIEVLGMTFKNRYAQYNTTNVDRYFPEKVGVQYVLGVVIKFKKIKDKNKNDMAFVKVDFIDGQTLELVMFASKYQQLEENAVYLFKISKRNILEGVGKPK